MNEIFEVRMQITSQSAAKGKFSIPQKVVDILDIDSSTNLLIEICSTKGVNSFNASIKSGNEIYGGLEGYFDSGELMTVKVTRIA